MLKGHLRCNFAKSLRKLDLGNKVITKSFSLIFHNLVLVVQLNGD